MAELDVKRIINFTTQSTLSDGDYVAVDSTGNGTKKFNLGGLLQPATTSTPGLMSSQDKTALNQAGDDITDLKEALGDIDNSYLFEMGNISISTSGWTYGASNTRVRTKEGTSLHIKSGVKIGLTDYTNTRYYIGWKNANDQYRAAGWLYADYTTVEEGDYVILITNRTEATQTDKTALSSLFFGYQGVAFDYISDNIDDIAQIEKLIYHTYPGFISQSGGINVPTASKEVYTSKIPVQNGTVVNFHSTFDVPRANWTAYCLWDANGAFISRTVLTEYTLLEFSKQITITNANAVYISFTYRTYDVISVDISSNYHEWADKYDFNDATIYLYKGRDALTPILLSSLTPYVDVIINNSVQQMVFPRDSFIITKEGQHYYVGSYSENITVDISLATVGSSAVKVVYNTKTGVISAFPYMRQLATFELLLAYVRTTINAASVTISCPYRLNGNLYNVSSANMIDYNNNIVKSVNHRGFYTAPENTLPAYRLSKQNGFKYVECDVSFTSDGVPVLLHDYTINRTARNADGSEISETIYINSITYEQASQYDFGIWKGAEYAGTKIPTLREFFMLCRGLGLHPYVELKASAAYTEAQIQSLVDLSNQCGLNGNITWISFNLTFLTYVKNYDSRARIGYVVNDVDSTTITNAETLKTADNDLFIDSGGGVSDENILLCVNANIPLEVWTVNTMGAIADLNPYITGVTSDSVRAEIALYNANM